MSEIEKLYKNAGIIKYGKRQCTDSTFLECQNYCFRGIDNKCDKFIIDYPPFTAEKQIAIEEVILQNKKNYNKWIEYNINVYGEWVIRFVRTDKFAPYIALEKTRAEALANVINNFWQDLSAEEKQQVKGILE